MRKWLSTLGYKLSSFMQGRYGYDEFSRFLLFAGVILMFLSGFPYLRFLYILGLAMLTWSWYRSLSRNIYKRQEERSKYLSIKSKVTQKFRLYKNMWRDRKTHRYYKCPSCKATVRITKPAKGRRIMVTCPKCRHSFEKQT